MPVERKKIRTRARNYIEEIAFMSLNSIINSLQESKAELEAEGWSDLRLEYDYNDRDRDFYIVGDRLETVEEATIREAQHATMQREQDRRDRETFERLKNKFG